MIYLFLVLLLCACGASAAETIHPPQTTLWGFRHLIAHAPQNDAPALWSSAGRTVSAWVQGNSLALRAFEDGQFSEVVIVPRTVRNPHQLMVFPGVGGSTHLFWLDTDENGETRVYSAFFNAALQIERGVIEVSDYRTEYYDVVANGDGSLWVVWSGGLQAERTIYANLIDRLGRPRKAQQVIDGADRPVFLQANQNLYLFWLQSDTIYRARFADATLSEITPLVKNLTLFPGDLLFNYEAAGDGYLFWNIVRADGTPETWMASAMNGWAEPERLGLGAIGDEPFQTGFNSGAVTAAQSGDRPLTWIVPLAGQYDVLPAAAQVGGEIVLVYFQNGAIAGSQAITSGQLTGLPSLITDINRHLYLAWSQPPELFFTSTR